MEPARSGSVVLVHGLWGNAHDWRWVREHLERAEVDVLAVDLPSHRMPTAGLLEDAATVREAIRQSEPPVVVTGWSYGGTVVSVAADGQSCVTRLVYVSDVPFGVRDHGFSDWIDRDPNVLTYPDGTFVLNNDWWLDEEAGTTFPAEVRQELRQHPRRRVSRKAMSDPQPAAAWQTIPSTLILGRHDDQPGANDLDTAIARFPDTHILDCDHFTIFREPAAVANIILRALRAQQLDPLSGNLGKIRSDEPEAPIHH